jgi:hypothetical protein
MQRLGDFDGCNCLFGYSVFTRIIISQYNIIFCTPSIMLYVCVIVISDQLISLWMHSWIHLLSVCHWKEKHSYDTCCIMSLELNNWYVTDICFSDWRCLLVVLNLVWRSLTFSSHVPSLTELQKSFWMFCDRPVGSKFVGLLDSVRPIAISLMFLWAF